MKRLNLSTKSFAVIIILLVFFLLSPSVYAGSFKFNIYPPTTPIKPGIEIREVNGVHQLIPNFIDLLLPSLWASQYTLIEVDEKPSWSSVSFPDATLLTPPDGNEHEIKALVSVSEDAPAYEYRTVKLSITTGRFMRTIFPSWFPLCNEFHMDQSFQIQAGYIPSLTVINPPSINLLPDSQKNISIQLTNTGNARSLLTFSVNVNDVPSGWFITPPGPTTINTNEEVNVSAIVHSPQVDGFIDEWIQIPLNIEMKSTIDPTGNSANYTVTISAHCINS